MDIEPTRTFKWSRNEVLEAALAADPRLTWAMVANYEVDEICSDYELETNDAALGEAIVALIARCF